MSLLGKIGGALTGAVGGFLTGGPGGALAGAAGALFGGGGGAKPVPAGSLPGGSSGTAFQFPGFGFTHLTAGGGGGGGGAVAAAAGGACPKGYHLNRHALPASKTHGAVGKLSICVRNRHMNAMNGRAVARAARRIHQGEKLLRRIYRVEGKAHGKIRPKTHGKAK